MYINQPLVTSQSSKLDLVSNPNVLKVFTLSFDFPSPFIKSSQVFDIVKDTLVIVTRHYHFVQVAPSKVLGP